MKNSLKFKKFFTSDELALGIKLILQKNHDSLTVIEINLLTEAIIWLEQLSETEKEQNKKNPIEKATQIVISILKFFCKNGQILKQIKQL